ncbi:hypothetical protein BLS_002564 [Venturia inaequalis]|uniref:Uncharacterized protein n=1 Tax=Venturia inaequalis TaxID=5025 RepID=A0A8H3VKG9_VENIN|nr:hypothetical protein BLS_002564 [Venturia inaequalis]KAE9988593.1 hypothetical protein EG328_009726 [Venturia inaequalis]KAE9992806.1 hypothetical protein EG327_007730 [Venturia inaequalis]RDI76926.1 hypothetical protein Vi05172_g13062 [Venturia inaequalis]
MSIFNTVLQSATLSIISNILAQVIDAYRKNIPLSLNINPILQFVTYSILNTPLNCYWQDFIESAFPSNVTTDVEVPNKTDEKAKALQRKQVFSVKNTLIKFALDQTLGAAVNIPLFIGIIGMTKGQSLDTITNSVKADFVDIYLSGMKLWPAVSLISFTVLPANRRVIFGSLAGVAWNIYLSLRSSR